MTTTATTATRKITTRKIDADGHLARREVILDGKVIGEITKQTSCMRGDSISWTCFLEVEGSTFGKFYAAETMGWAILNVLAGHLDRAEWEAAAAQFKVRLLG